MKMSKEIKYLLLVSIIVIGISGILYLVLKNNKENQEGQKADYSNIILKSASEQSYSQGPIAAKVTVTEFFDPECETCAQVAPYIKNEMKFYENKVRWVFRYMAYHPNSTNAIKILEAARKQNLYMEAMSLLLSRQSEWGAKHDGSDKNLSKEKELLKIISSLPNIDMKKLSVDMSNPDILKLIEVDKQEGEKMGVTGTPTLFVNGKIIDPLSLDTMIAQIENELK